MSMETQEKESRIKQIRQWCQSRSLTIVNKTFFLFKNPISFISIFLIGIPLLFLPISFLPSEIFMIISIILIIAIGISIFLNLNYVWLTFKNLNEPKSSDYRNVLHTVEKISSIQRITSIIGLVSVFGLIVVSNTLISIPDYLSEPLHLIFIYFIFPSVISLAFSTLYIVVTPTGKKYDIYLMNSWILVIENHHTDSEKITCLKKCIENYDDFLYRVIEQRMENLDELFANFLVHDTKNIDTIVTEVKECLNQDEFSLLKYLKEFKNDDEKPILTINPLKHNKLTLDAETIKDISKIVGSAITVGVVLLKLLEII